MEEENKKPEGEQPEANEPVKTEHAAEEQNDTAKSSEGKPSADERMPKESDLCIGLSFRNTVFLAACYVPE